MRGLKVPKNATKAFGPIAFFGLTGLAIISGLFGGFLEGELGTTYRFVTVIAMLILGIFVGLVNITKNEVIGFLMAILTLLMAGAGTILLIVIVPFGSVFGAILVNVIAAYSIIGLTVAFRTIWKYAPKP